jgi:hypothetical protein
MEGKKKEREKYLRAGEAAGLAEPFTSLDGSIGDDGMLRNVPACDQPRTFDGKKLQQGELWVTRPCADQDEMVSSVLGRRRACCMGAGSFLSERRLCN